MALCLLLSTQLDINVYWNLLTYEHITYEYKVKSVSYTHAQVPQFKG